MVKLYAKYQKSQGPDGKLQGEVSRLMEALQMMKRRVRIYARKYRDAKEKALRAEAEHLKDLELARRDAAASAAAQAEANYQELLAAIGPLRENEKKIRRMKKEVRRAAAEVLRRREEESFRSHRRRGDRHAENLGLSLSLSLSLTRTLTLTLTLISHSQGGGRGDWEEGRPGKTQAEAQTEA
mmetsp:Transcript_21606/g.66028  ORF Transcript_21606/g.66028 Transcript_21606/m.66028 type:complete len:183 (-) Transcript_21606:20-568(-)